MVAIIFEAGLLMRLPPTLLERGLALAIELSCLTPSLRLGDMLIVDSERLCELCSV